MPILPLLHENVPPGNYHQRMSTYTGSRTVYSYMWKSFAKFLTLLNRNTVLCAMASYKATLIGLRIKMCLKKV